MTVVVVAVAVFGFMGADALLHLAGADTQWYQSVGVVVFLLGFVPAMLFLLSFSYYYSRFIAFRAVNSVPEPDGLDDDDSLSNNPGNRP